MKEYTLENSTIEVKVIPELGGRIDSLIYKPTDKNWVWKNKQLENAKVPKHANYDNNWQGGWEELFPNDAIENFSWGEGLDHGELWSAEWTIKKASSQSLNLSTINLDSRTVFEKNFVLNENKLSVNYSGLVHFTDYFLFKLHLAVPVSKNVNIDCDFIDISNVDENFGNISDLKNNFFNLQENSNLYGFAYINLQNNNVKITDENLNTLELSYSGDLKYFWLFQTQGVWNEHNVLVLEPASNSKKYLVDAVRENGALKGPREFKCSYSVIIDKSN